MFSPFAIETHVAEDNPLSKAYDVLGQLAPLILQHQEDGTIKALVVEAGAPPQQLQMGNYIFNAAVGRGWGAAPPPTPAPAAAPGAAPVRSAGGVPQTPPGRGPLPVRGYAIIIQTGPDDFWVAGANLSIRLASTVAATPMASLAAVEEGKFENGTWVVQRHLAGDDTGMGGEDRASLRLTANPGILKVSLFSYR